MRYKYLPGIDKPLSALTYGTPHTATNAKTRAEAFRSYDLAWEAGFRTFDTAHSYGAGEETLGAWLTSRKHRHEAVILDKGCNPGQNGSADIFSGRTVREQVEESLRRLQTDHVELYILHRDDASVPVDEIVEELNALWYDTENTWDAVHKQAEQLDELIEEFNREVIKGAIFG